MAVHRADNGRKEKSRKCETIDKYWFAALISRSAWVWHGFVCSLLRHIIYVHSFRANKYRISYTYTRLSWMVERQLKEYTFLLCKRNKLALVLNDRIFGASLLIFWWYRIRYSIFAARFVFGIENPHQFKIHTDQTDIIAHCCLRREHNEVLFIVHNETVSFGKNIFFYSSNCLKFCRFSS